MEALAVLLLYALKSSLYYFLTLDLYYFLTPPNIQARPVTDKMVVEGWTDWTGSDAYNLRLSQRRAQVVKSYLVKHGIASDRITTSGEGKSFKYNNHTPEGRYANRRAEIIFVKENTK